MKKWAGSFGGVAHSVQHSDVKSTLWVTLGLYGMGCMAPQPFAAGGGRSYSYPQAVIPHGTGNLPQQSALGHMM
jgi:hypothetical protein